MIDPLRRARDGVLVTRPDAAAAETAARLAALGWRPVMAPLLTVSSRPLKAVPGRLQAILVTSRNALPALPASLCAVPLLAVGDATAERARAAGFVTVHSAGGDAAALAALAGRLCHPERGALLLASGAGQGTTLAAALRACGFRVHRRITYAARPVPVLPPPALTALRAGEIAAALFFSAATARAFVRLAHGALPPVALAEVVALALSPATGRALGPLPWRAIRVASHPNQDELLTLLP